MSRPQFLDYMIGMMIRIPFAPPLLALALIGLSSVAAWAQNSIPALPSPTPATGVARPPISVPSTPDIAVPALPKPPELGDIPTAPVAALAAVRNAGADAGPEPARPAPDQHSIVYAVGDEPVPVTAAAVLADYIARLKARPNERLELHAYATGRPDRPMDGRRTALMRVRHLRDQLVQQGIDPLRLVIFAESALLDGPAGSPPANRVDLVIRR